MDICKKVSKLRFENNRSESVMNAKRGDQTNEYTDFQGLCGEFAFCKLFNLYPDLTIHVRSSGKNDNMDARLHNGKTVDVKVTKYKNGKLIAVPWKKPTGDYFALMVGEAPTFEFKGFMKQDELLREERIGDLGYGPTYIANQTDLSYDID